jgi:DNA-binding transcriptional LysR family regulator
MSYRDCLHTFLTVYRLGSQNKAAESLALTQPAVSQHIKMLEHYLGRPLFTRAGRGLQPTAVAHQLALEVTDPLDALDGVLNTLRQGEQKLKGNVYVGGLSGFFAKVVVPLLPTLADYDICVRFEIDYETLVPRLLNNELDIAQFTEHVTHPQLTVEKLYHQKFVLIGHPKFKGLLNKKQLDDKDTSCLRDLPWITYSETFLFIKEYYQTVFQQELVIADLWAILEAVRSGFGVTVFPAFFCREYIESKNVQILYETENVPNHFLYLGWKQGALRDPKTKLVYELFKQACS